MIWALADKAILRPVLGMAGALVVSGGLIAWSVLA